PESSSRMNSASDVGSTTGSLANDVNRFSLLFSDQVCAEPDAVTTVPKWAFAMTFAHGNGVSRSPSRTIAEARPRDGLDQRTVHFADQISPQEVRTAGSVLPHPPGPGIEEGRELCVYLV